MVHRFINTREANNIKIIFNALDSEKDGEIEYREFKYNLKALFGLTLVDKELKRMFKKADMSSDGIIQYTECLIAGCNKYDILSDLSLRTAFTNMDYDKDGKISKADYDFLIRGFDADKSTPFMQTEHGKDWAKMIVSLKKQLNYEEEDDIPEITY
jgi:Ca2+-binding EF-hand superfamily protein